MHLLIWALLLLLIGFALAGAEVFVPSGGTLGVLAALSILLAILLAFFVGPWVGLAMSVTAAVIVPAIMAMAFKVWPNTSIGRQILLPVPTAADVLPDDAALRELKQLLGRVGVVKSPMRPSGAIQIDERTIDALAQGMAIEVGQKVRVVDVHGTRVTVRPEEDDAVDRRSASDPLSQSLNALGLEDLSDPLA